MKKWETVKEVMERTSLYRNSVMTYLDKPGISVRIGRSIRFDADAVDKALLQINELNNEDDKFKNG